MTKSDPRAHRLAARRQQILDAARAAAEADGWAGVTSRRLADAIGYSQPVLYSHFPGGKTEIMRTVALAGFVELTEQTRTEMGRHHGARAIAAVARAYLEFASANPAVYEAMFQQPINARFADEDGEAELHTGFAALGAALGEGENATRTEILWSALHGMSLLERAGRMRADDRPLRIAELADRFQS